MSQKAENDSKVGQKRARILQAGPKGNLHLLPRFSPTWSLPFMFCPKNLPTHPIYNIKYIDDEISSSTHRHAKLYNNILKVFFD